MTEDLGRFYYLPNARSPEQRAEMVALEAAGICIFCPEAYSRQAEREVLLEFEGGVSLKKQVLAENDSWAILLNEYPYPGTLTHIMLVPKEHVTRLVDLAEPSRQDFWDILEIAHGKFELGDYNVLGVRNGNPAFTGATICHLHIQLATWDPSYPGEPPRLYMGSRQPPAS